jgi:tetratricopeptide (TPR) repeat protein
MENRLATRTREDQMTSNPLKAVGLVLCALLILAAPSAAQKLSTQVTGIGPDRAITSPGTEVAVQGTGFSADTIVYFGGVEARKTIFVSPSSLQVVTPYLRPGSYQLQAGSEGSTATSDVTFTALPAKPDTEIDRATSLARDGNMAAALAILGELAKFDDDFQVRARAHYESGQIYFAHGDWWRWGGEMGAIFTPDAGSAVQTSWRYRLGYAYSVYALPVDSVPDTALRLADWTVKYDVTGNPEPRFLRSLMNARYGNLQAAKGDSDAILRLYPDNSSYRALAAYIAVLGGNNAAYQPFDDESIKEPRALGLLGEAAYLNGDDLNAKTWWDAAAKLDPPRGTLACWIGKKHAGRGQSRVAAALLAECQRMAPNSKEAVEAKDLLPTVGGHLLQ